MDVHSNSSFASLYSCPINSPSKRRRSRIMTPLKYLTQRSDAKPLALECPGKLNNPKGSTRTWDSWHITWKRRGQTPGMDDYLTLEQLENVWYTQDFYVGCISVPQKVTQYTFTDAVEAPLIAEHSLNARRQQESRQPTTEFNIVSPDNPPEDDRTAIGGAIHPALRPLPYLKDSPLLCLTPSGLTEHND